MIPTRITCAALFIIVMFGVREVAHVVVDAGVVAWLAAIGAIFAVGIAIENRDRRITGRAPYSLAESRELLIPISILMPILALAYWLAR